MFSNQISFKNLFSRKPGQLLKTKSDAGDLAVEGGNSQSGSQQLYSQIELTDSQDANSQTLSSGNSQSSNSPGKKTSQKYMTKGPLYREAISNKAFQFQRLGNFQQHVHHNQTRAKDRDERDVLQVMLNNVKECTVDMKTTMCVIKDSIEKGATTTEHQLLKCLEAIQDGLDKYSEEMLNIIHTKDDHLKELTNLHEQLAQKDSRMEELQEQVKSLEEKEQHHVLKVMQKTLKEQEIKTQDHMKQQYQHHQQEMQYATKNQERVYIDLLNHTQDWHQKMFQDSKDAFKQLGERIDESLDEQRTKPWPSEMKLRKEIEEQIEHVLELQRNEIGSLLARQFNELKKDGDDRYNELVQEQHNSLIDMQGQQKRELERYLKQQVHLNVNHTEEQLRQMVNTLWQEQSETMQRLQEEQQEHFKRQLSEKYENELQALKDRHKEEVARLTAEKEERRRILETEKAKERDAVNEFSSLVFSPYLEGPPAYASPGLTLNAGKVFNLTSRQQSFGRGFSSSNAFSPGNIPTASEPSNATDGQLSLYKTTKQVKRFDETGPITRSGSLQHRQEMQGVSYGHQTMEYPPSLMSKDLFCPKRCTNDSTLKDILSPRTSSLKDVWSSRNQKALCVASPSQVATVLPQARYLSEACSKPGAPSKSEVCSKKQAPKSRKNQMLGQPGHPLGNQQEVEETNADGQNIDETTTKKPCKKRKKKNVWCTTKPKKKKNQKASKLPNSASTEDPDATQDLGDILAVELRQQEHNKEVHKKSKVYDFEDHENDQDQTDSRLTYQYTRCAITQNNTCTSEESRWQAALKMPSMSQKSTWGSHSQSYRKFMESARQCLSPVLAGEVFSQTNTVGDTSSRDSSPSMSVMEVIIQRKVKQDKKLMCTNSDSEDVEDRNVYVDQRSMTDMLPPTRKEQKTVSCRKYQPKKKKVPTATLR